MANIDCLEWLKYARMDIDYAQQGFSQQQNPRHRPIELILYHCQQGAEKALKAFIINNLNAGIVLPRALQTHDMQIIRQACLQWSKQFNNVRLIGHCAFLDPFGVAIKYPQYNRSVDSSHAARGLNSAKRVYDFVCVQLGMTKIYFP